MFTSKDNEHNHQLAIDGQGTGKTIDTSYGVPHTHEVKDYVVEEVKDHIHTIEEASKENVLGEDDGKGPKFEVPEVATTEENIEKHRLKVEVTVG